MTDRTAGGYGLVSIMNHWVLGVAALGLVAAGLAASGMERGPERSALIATHKAFGALMLLAGLWRIGWRLREGFPAPAHAGWRAGAATAMHWFLMAAIVVMAASGLLWSLNAGRPVSLFGIAEIPAFARNESLAETFETVHRLFSKAFIGAIALHIAGAVWTALAATGDEALRMFSPKR